MSNEQIEGLFIFIAYAGLASVVMCIGGLVALLIGRVIDKRNEGKL